MTARSDGRTLGAAYDRKRNNFDAIRFGLATVVIWSHCFPLAGRAEDWCYALSRQVDAGSLAVDAFFILSGFLVAQSWRDAPQARRFLLKRALRIVPALLVALGFGALVIGPFVAQRSPAAYVTSADPWLHFLGIALHRYLAIAGSFATNPLPEAMNYSLWSLRYEMACYLMVVVLGIACRRTWRAAVGALFAVAWACTLAVELAGPGVPSTLAVSIRLLTAFAAGMALYAFRDVIPDARALAAGAAAVLGITFFTAGFRVAFPLAGGYLLCFLAFTRRIPLQRFGRYGDFSYGLYVFAYPVQQAIVYWLGAGVPIALLFPLSLAVTLLVSVASWHWVEAPALAWKSRLARAPAVPMEALTA